MRTGLTISTVGHAVLLAWGLVSFSAKPFEAAPVESLPVDIVSATEFSQMTAGAKTAPRAETPKPLVEKIAAPEPAKDATPKVVDKPEIQTASAEPTPPAPAPKPPDAKAEDKKSEPKTDPIVEALKKEEAKKADPPKPPMPPKKPPQPKLDLNKIESKLALLDKRDSQRQAATGATLNPTAGLGAPTGNALALNQNEIDALRARLRECWDVPVGVLDAPDLVVVVRVQFRRDGSLADEPVVMNRSSHPVFQVATESALRALRKCAPFTFLPVAKYDVWKDIEVKFDPRDMYRG